MKQTFKQANYTYIKHLEDNTHLLKDNNSDNLEVWVNNRNHASYGLIYKNTHLEFCHSF